MKTSCGKFLNLAHYFPYDVKLRLLAHSRSFLANQKARNAIVGAENLLIVLRQKHYCLNRNLEQLIHEEDARERQKRPLKNYLLTCNCWYLRRIHGPLHKRLLVLIALKIFVLRASINSQNRLKQKVKVT